MNYSANGLDALGLLLTHYNSILTPTWLDLARLIDLALFFTILV